MYSTEPLGYQLAVLQWSMVSGVWLVCAVCMPGVVCA